MTKRRPLSLDYFCGGPKELKVTHALLKERGVEILAPTNSYEVIRFRAKTGVGVVYRNLRGRYTANDQALETFRAIVENEGGSLAPVQVTKRRVQGERRAGELAAILERDGTECFFCGKELPPLNASLDPELAPTIEHLVARAHGGPEHISNKFAAHKCCNEAAGHLSAPEKIALRDRLRAEGIPKAQAA